VVSVDQPVIPEATVVVEGGGVQIVSSELPADTLPELDELMTSEVPCYTGESLDDITL